MAKKKRIFVIVSLQIVLLVYGAFAAHHYFTNAVRVNELYGSYAINTDGSPYFPGRDRLPVVETIKNEYYPYLMRVQWELAEKYEYYSFLYSENLELETDVKQTGLFRFEITYSGSGTSEDGETRVIDDRFEIDCREIYWGREATIETSAQKRGDIE